MLTIVDDCTRECPVIEVDTSLGGLGGGPLSVVAVAHRVEGESREVHPGSAGDAGPNDARRAAVPVSVAGVGILRLGQAARATSCRFDLFITTPIIRISASTRSQRSTAIKRRHHQGTGTKCHLARAKLLKLSGSVRPPEVVIRSKITNTPAALEEHFRSIRTGPYRPSLPLRTFHSIGSTAPMRPSRRSD